MVAFGKTLLEMNCHKDRDITVSRLRYTKGVIYLLLGENTYRVEQELRRLLADGVVLERPDVSKLNDATLSDVMRGATLFSAQRSILLKGLSEQKDLWEKFAAWASEVPRDTTVVAVESRLDKRTKAYKTLVKHAELITCDFWTDRDAHLAEEWLDTVARSVPLVLSRPQISNMVQRAQFQGEKPGQFFIDQMQLAQAVKALSVLDEVNDDTIAAVLPPAPSESVFRLLECAIQQEIEQVSRLLVDVRRSEEPYLVFTALTKQWAQLVMVALVGQRSNELTIHPFVLGKLRAQASYIKQADIRSITQLAADLDSRMKVSEVTPWQAVDRFVMAVTLRK